MQIIIFESANFCHTSIRKELAASRNLQSTIIFGLRCKIYKYIKVLPIKYESEIFTDNRYLLNWF